VTDFPYTTVPGKLSKLLSKIREVGVPTKATSQWLKSVGFTSSNDPSLLTVLRYVGLLDDTGAPTDKWRNYRGAQHGQVLANAIRQSYAKLFSVYPDAHSRSSSDVENVVSTVSNAGKQVVTKTVRTFQVLCSAADFSATGQIDQLHQDLANHDTGTTQPPKGNLSGGDGVTPSLHINIQVHISPDATVEQIDQIFKSMAKHLYKEGN
jgi:hypothetical protein